MGGALTEAEARAEGVLDAERWPAALGVEVHDGWAPCPLCGRGEAGGDHLVVWCPAVAAAVRGWTAERRTLISLLREPPAQLEAVRRVLHQASLLNCSLRGRAAMRWRQAAGWLVRACRAYRPATHAEDEEDTGAPHEDGHSGELSMWGVKPQEGCSDCSAFRGERLVDISNVADAGRHEARPCDIGRLLITNRRVGRGQRLGVFYGMEAVGMWPVAQRNWCPRTRIVDDPAATASWTLMRCPRCSCW